MTLRARNSYRKRRRASWGLLALTVAAALALTGLVSSGSAASANKTLNCTTISPNPVAATGSSMNFTLHLCNDRTSPNQLGSAQIAAPTGFAITNVTGLPAGAAWDPTTRILTNLGLAPGASADLTVTATTPSLCADPGNLSWSIYAKQANNFSGPPGNNYSPYPFQLRQYIIGSCTLAFVNQPDETAGTTAVRDTKWGAIRNSGNSIQVQVGSGGSPFASASGTVTITASSGCSFATGATTTASFSSGVATFSNLTLANVAGQTGCVLHASSSAGYAAADSNSFNVDPANLYFSTQPANAVVNTVLTDVVNGGTVSPPAGDPIQVGVQTTDGTNSQSFSGTGGVSIALASTGTNCALASSGTSATLSSGVASFSGLTPTSAPASGCELTATSTTYNQGTSGPFDVAQSGCYGPCTFDTPLGNGADVQTTASGGFDFVILNSNPYTPGVPQGCANFTGTGAGFVEQDGRSGSASLDFVITITDQSLKHAYGPNYGMPNVPICLGAKKLVNDPATGKPTAVDCTPGQPGFPSRNLGANHAFNGTYGNAICGAGGYDWGIVETRQDSNSDPNFDPTAPVISSWSTAGNLRQWELDMNAWDAWPKI